MIVGKHMCKMKKEKNSEQCHEACSIIMMWSHHAITSFSTGHSSKAIRHHTA